MGKEATMAEAINVEIGIQKKQKKRIVESTSENYEKSKNLPRVILPVKTFKNE